MAHIPLWAETVPQDTSCAHCGDPSFALQTFCRLYLWVFTEVKCGQLGFEIPRSSLEHDQGIRTTKFLHAPLGVTGNFELPVLFPPVFDLPFRY